MPPEQFEHDSHGSRAQGTASPGLSRLVSLVFVSVSLALAGSTLAACAAGGAAGPAQGADQAPGGSSPNPTNPTPADSGRLDDLADPAKRSRTIEVLIEEFDEKAKNGTKTGPAVAFIDTFAEPLTNAYVEHRAELDDKLRRALVNLLVSFDDERTLPAHAAALRSYAEDPQAIEEAIWACQAAKKHRSPALASALLYVFERLDMGDHDGRRFSAHLSSAMAHNVVEGWAVTLRDKLSQPLTRPKRYDDAKAVSEFNTGLYWQRSALILLGLLHDGKAAPLVLETLMDSSRSDLHAVAERTWLQLGAAAAPAAERFLAGDDDELLRAARAARKDVAEPHIFFASLALADLGHPGSVPALQRAWAKTNDAVSRVLLALALTQLPSDDESLKIFRDTYNRTTTSTTLPRGEGALEALAEAAPNTFEPSLVEFLTPQVGRVKGTWARKGDLQRSLVVSIGQLATLDQLPAIRATAQKYGGRVGTLAFDAAEAVTRRCGKSASCYLKVALTPSGGDDVKRFGALKAATMLGVLNSPKELQALGAQLTSIKDNDVKARAAHALARLPKDAQRELASALADELNAQDDGDADPIIESLYYRLLVRSAG